LWRHLVAGPGQFSDSATDDAGLSQATSPAEFDFVDEI
jgi:hypothetical protein